MSKQDKLIEQTAIVIAAYNEEKSIRGVVEDLEKQHFKAIVVNDGSKDSTAREVKKTSAKLINHPINLGQGGALQTGIEYAVQKTKAEFIVTFDADGQHRIEDVISMLKVLDEDKNLDIALGSRFLGLEADNMSGAKSTVLKLGTKFMNFITGMKLTDTHNGLRVMRRRFAERLEITMSDMAHASDILSQIADKKAKYKEVPVKIIYSDYSMSRSNNPLMNSINILFDVILNKLHSKKR